MVVAHGYRPSGWLEPMRLFRGRFKGKGAVDGTSPFPVADSPETTPPGPGSNTSTHLAKKFLSKTLILCGTPWIPALRRVPCTLYRASCTLSQERHFSHIVQDPSLPFPDILGRMLRRPLVRRGKHSCQKGCLLRGEVGSIRPEIFF